MNLDVTPVRGAPGERAAAAPLTGGPGGPDPFGARPTRARRGWVRIVLGLIAVLGGCVALGAGIVDAVRESDRLLDDAVAHGVVGSGATAATFSSAGGEHTVYLRFAGVTGNSTRQERAVGDTDCVVDRADGGRTTIRGARQGTSVTLGDNHTVGRFTAPAGETTVRCAYVQRLRTRLRPDAVPFFVTPGGPSDMLGLFGLILGGVAAALLGGALIAWGWRRRVVVRRRSRIGPGPG